MPDWDKDLMVSPELVGADLYYYVMGAEFTLTADIEYQKTASLPLKTLIVAGTYTIPEQYGQTNDPGELPGRFFLNERQYTTFDGLPTNVSDPYATVCETSVNARNCYHLHEESFQAPAAVSWVEQALQFSDGPLDTDWRFRYQWQSYDSVTNVHTLSIHSIRSPFHVANYPTTIDIAITK